MVDAGRMEGVGDQPADGSRLDRRRRSSGRLRFERGADGDRPGFGRRLRGRLGLGAPFGFRGWLGLGCWLGPGAGSDTGTGSGSAAGSAARLAAGSGSAAGSARPPTRRGRRRSGSNVGSMVSVIVAVGSSSPVDASNALAVVLELERDDFRSSSRSRRDHPLEIVLALARDPDRVALDLRLDLGELVADQLGELLRARRRAGPCGA